MHSTERQRHSLNSVCYTIVIIFKKCVSLTDGERTLKSSLTYLFSKFSIIIYTKLIWQKPEQMTKKLFYIVFNLLYKLKNLSLTILSLELYWKY